MELASTPYHSFGILTARSLFLCIYLCIASRLILTLLYEALSLRLGSVEKRREGVEFNGLDWTWVYLLLVVEEFYRQSSIHSF